MAPLYKPKQKKRKCCRTKFSVKKRSRRPYCPIHNPSKSLANLRPQKLSRSKKQRTTLILDGYNQQLLLDNVKVRLANDLDGDVRTYSGPITRSRSTQTICSTSVGISSAVLIPWVTVYTLHRSTTSDLFIIHTLMITIEKISTYFSVPSICKQLKNN